MALESHRGGGGGGGILVAGTNPFNKCEQRI